MPARSLLCCRSTLHCPRLKQHRCICRRGQAASLLCLLTVPHRLQSCTLPALMPCARCLCWASWLAMVRACRLLIPVLYSSRCMPWVHRTTVLSSATAGGSIIDAAAMEVSASSAHPPTLRELMDILIAFHSLPAGTFSALFVQMAAHTAPCKGNSAWRKQHFHHKIWQRSLSNNTAV
jgi:hypothetical protein